MRVARAPLRVSLVGGGTDIPAFYEKYTGRVVSFAINKYVYCAVKELPDLFPYKYKLGYSTTELCNDIDEIKHPIIREVLRKYNVKSLDLAVMADIPAGTGMGSSSAFTVALIKALVPSLSGSALAEAACDIEINILNEPIGKQDQYAAAFGGCNYFLFTKDTVFRYPLSPWIGEYCHLFRVGKERSASNILKNTDNSALVDMPDLARQCKEAIEQDRLYPITDIINRGWDLKKRSNPLSSTSEIEGAIEEFNKTGCRGVKLLGAGQSGFILVVGSLDYRTRKHEKLGKQLHFSIDTEGAKIL